MLEAKFQGANNPDFSDAVDLYTVNEIPEFGRLTFTDVEYPGGFRYLRYFYNGPEYANIAEIAFFGVDVEVIVSVPDLPTMPADNSVRLIQAFSSGELVLEYQLRTPATITISINNIEGREMYRSSYKNISGSGSLNERVTEKLNHGFYIASVYACNETCQITSHRIIIIN